MRRGFTGWRILPQADPDIRQNKTKNFRQARKIDNIVRKKQKSDVSLDGFFVNRPM
jgi:hypothetical protein